MHDLEKKILSRDTLYNIDNMDNMNWTINGLVLRNGKLMLTSADIGGNSTVAPGGGVDANDVKSKTYTDFKGNIASLIRTANFTIEVPDSNFTQGFGKAVSSATSAVSSATAGFSALYSRLRSFFERPTQKARISREIFQTFIDHRARTSATLNPTNKDIIIKTINNVNNFVTKIDTIVKIKDGTTDVNTLNTNKESFTTSFNETFNDSYINTLHDTNKPSVVEEAADKIDKILKLFTQLFIDNDNIEFPKPRSWGLFGIGGNPPTRATKHHKNYHRKTRKIKNLTITNLPRGKNKKK